MKIMSIETIDKFPKKELKKHNIVKMTYHKIYTILDKAEKANMKKYHTTIQTSAITEWILERCGLKHGNTYYIFKDRFDTMLRKYKQNKINSPYDLGYDRFNPLMRMFLEGNVSEC